MCGYCTEIYSIQIAMEQSRGQLWDSESDKQQWKFVYYLQECHDLNLALLSNPQGTQALIKFIDAQSKKTEYIYHAPLEVIFCRVIETLVKYGFDSREYQTLITNDIIRQIVEYEVKRPVIPGENLILPTTPLETLIGYEMFTVEKRWREIANTSSLMSACKRQLNTYIDWWHSRIEASSKKTDGPNETAVFQRVYPLVFLSLMVIARDNPNHKSIHRLIETNPDAPLFEALELWLQRKAASILYDAVGLSAFLPYAQNVRSVLIYYLVVSNKLNKMDKDILYEAIIKSERYDENDTESGSPFYLFIEPMIMEHIS